MVLFRLDKEEPMLDSLVYTPVDGPHREHDITVFALSTCGFCKKALAFLRDQGIAHRFIHVDTIPVETKNEIKRILKETYHDDVAFPFVTIDSREHLVGFIEADWRKTLGL
jgi:glutaredoxin